MTTTLEIEPLSLTLRTPFTLSYGTTTIRENVLIRLRTGDQVAFGEAAVVPYYHETAERVTAYLSSPAVREAVSRDPLHLEDALSMLPPTPSSFAHAALDIALHDRWGAALGEPLWRLWGLNPARCPATSYTIAMDDDEAAYLERVRIAGQRFGLLKLKAGSQAGWEHDWQRIQAARQVTHAALCIDANNGWDRAAAQAIIPRLGELGVAFVEQPLPRADLDGWRELRRALPTGHPALFADEAVQGVESVAPLAGLADGINIKLAKCGGLRAARDMIALARAFGMQVMIGCMVESSIAVTAAAHLAPLADYADLDANLLIADDPYEGVLLDGDRLVLPDRPGLGVIARVAE